MMTLVRSGSGMSAMLPSSTHGEGAARSSAAWLKNPRPVWATDSLAQALPNARRVVIKDAGHLPWLEQPRAVADQIRGFLVQHQACNQ